MKKIALLLALLFTLNGAIAAPLVEIDANGGVKLNLQNSKVSEKYTNKQNALIKAAESKRAQQIAAIQKQINAKKAELKRIQTNAKLTKEQKKAQLAQKKKDIKALQTRIKNVNAATKKEIKVIVQ